MKKCLVFLFILSFVAFSCRNNKEGETALLTEKIEYDVNIVNNEPDADWWIQNIEGSKREKFVNLVINGAKNQTIKIFDNNFIPTSFKKVVSDFFSYDTVNFKNKIKNIETDSVFISNLFDVSKINSFKFIEEWTYNDKTFEFQKNVNKYCPVLRYIGEKNKITDIQLFWVIPDTNVNDKPNKQTITEKIQYDVNITSGNNIEWWKDNIEKSSKEKFLNQLIKKIEKQEVIAYDYFNKIIDKEKFNNIFHRIDTVLIEDLNNPGTYNDTVLKRDIDVNSITKIRFIEEWTIDLNTLKISKNIISYSPLIEYVDDNGNIRGYTPLFWLHFNKKP